MNYCRHLVFAGAIRRVGSKPSLAGRRRKLSIEKQDGSRSIWTVEGLVHPGLQRTLFTFKNDKLMEVELQYRISRLVDRALQ